MRRHDLSVCWTSPVQEHQTEPPANIFSWDIPNASFGRRNYDPTECYAKSARCPLPVPDRHTAALRGFYPNHSAGSETSVFRQSSRKHTFAWSGVAPVGAKPPFGRWERLASDYSHFIAAGVAVLRHERRHNDRSSAYCTSPRSGFVQPYAQVRSLWSLGRAFGAPLSYTLSGRFGASWMTGEGRE